MGFVLGIDVSTTATKAVLVDEAGTVRGSGAAEYGFDVPPPLWSEQDPRAVVGRAVAAIRSVLATTGSPATEIDRGRADRPDARLVLLGCRGEVLRPAILWNDQRTAAECDAIRAAVGPERLIEITGNDALTGFTAPKLVWVRDHEPDVWRRTRHVLLPKDYLRLRLDRRPRHGQGRRCRDHPVRPCRARLVARGPRGARDRSGVAATDLGRPGRSPAGSAPRPPSRDRPPGRHAGRRRWWRSGGQRGRRRGGPGRHVALSLGTSGVVFATTDRPLHEPRGVVHAFCHAVPGRWHLMSVMLSAAGSLRWFRDAVAPGVEFGDLVAPAAEVPVGSGGLLFLPYLSGERSPHPDPLARGAFVGLTLSHDRRHLTRAVLEGVAFGLRDGLDLMIGAGTAGPDPDPGVRRRDGEPVVAPDPGRRPRRRDRHGQHDRGCRLRRRPAGRGRGGLVPGRGGRRRRAGHA